jgi:iron-sulfur cluster repair protein YtfE (RIC family)
MSGDPSGRLSHATFAELIASEHAIVRGHLDHMRSIADNAQQEVPLRLRNQLDAVLSFLHNDLIAHMQGEEEVLYPALEHVAAAWSCEAMRFDHDAIIGMIDETRPAHLRPPA